MSGRSLAFHFLVCKPDVLLEYGLPVRVLCQLYRVGRDLLRNLADGKNELFSRAVGHAHALLRLLEDALKRGEIKDAKSVKLKNGKPATKGTCPKCGTKMFRIGG